VDLGLARVERQVRKLMAYPPSRQFQNPYEIAASEEVDPFEQRLNELARGRMRELSLRFLARELAMSSRTLSRRFWDELHLSPGKWIQRKRLDLARSLLEATRLGIAEVCYRVGYQDVASFSRLFSRTTGMTPGEFRRALRPQA